MELYQRLLAKELGPVKQYFMIRKVVYILYLERRHPDFPDNPARGRAELYIVRRNQGLGQGRIIMLLCQLLMREIQKVLIDKTPVETFSLLVKGAIAIIRQNSVLKGLVHSSI